MEGTVKIFSKRYGMRAYTEFINYLYNENIYWTEEEDSQTIKVTVVGKNE